MALLTDKAQAFVGPIGAAREPTARAHLAGIVRINLDTDAAYQRGLVRQQAVQFCKGPLRGVPVGSSLLLAGPLAVLALGSLANAGQVFQPDEGRGMGLQDVRTDGVVGIQLKPSLSSAQPDTLSR